MTNTELNAKLAADLYDREILDRNTKLASAEIVRAVLLNDPTLLPENIRAARTALLDLYLLPEKGKP